MGKNEVAKAARIKKVINNVMDAPGIGLAVEQGEVIAQNHGYKLIG